MSISQFFYTVKKGHIKTIEESILLEIDRKCILKKISSAIQDEKTFVPDFKVFTVLIKEAVQCSELADIYCYFNPFLQHLKCKCFFVSVTV